MVKAVKKYMITIFTISCCCLDIPVVAKKLEQLSIGIKISHVPHKLGILPTVPTL
jgi:hypothetical protein